MYVHPFSGVYRAASAGRTHYAMKLACVLAKHESVKLPAVKKENISCNKYDCLANKF
jgi:hypothetical protein